jgi:hypothetical protein
MKKQQKHKQWIGLGLSVSAALTMTVTGCGTFARTSDTSAQHSGRQGDTHASSPANNQQKQTAGSGAQSAAGQSGTEHETAVSKVTETHIPGNRIINGKVVAIRGNQIQVDIGNPQPLYLPLKSGTDKDLTFKEGDPIVVTMNDHNAVVDYHHNDAQQGKEGVHHDVIQGQLAEPLTVGFEKAVIRTQDGERSYWIASTARAKLGAIPTGVDADFLRDETGQIVDAHLATDADQNAARHTKARMKGAHEQVQAVFKGMEAQDRIKVTVPAEQKERVMPFRPPLQKLDRLQENQHVVLLVDEEGYVVEIATPDTPPVR